MTEETLNSGLLYNSIYRLLNFEKYSSFQVAARETAVNNNFQMVIFTADFNVVFAVETRKNVRIEDAVRLWFQKGSDKDAKSTPLDVDGVDTYWGPINIDGVKYYLMLVDNEKKYSQDDMIKLASIIELAIGMWHYLPERNHAAELLRALRHGNRELAHALVMDLGLRETDCCGVFFVPNVDKDKSLAATAAFENETGLRTIKMNEGRELIGILVEDAVHKASIEAWAALREKFYAAGASKIFCINCLSGIEDMCSSFRLINETEAFADIVFPRKRCYGRCELSVVANCVNICMKNDRYKKIFLDLLAPLQKTGSQKNRMLIDTLSAFMLDADLSAVETAKILDVHVNTIQYRLKKIKNLFLLEDINFTRDTGMLMALAMLRLEKEVRLF